MARRPFIAFFSLLILLSRQPALAQPEAGVDFCAIAQEALHDASRIRGLRIRRSVPCVVQNQEQVRRFLVDTVTAKLPADRLRHEEAVYKALGIIPRDFSYVQGLIDLYVSQLGGYYDPEKKRFAVAGWMPALIQRPIAVHELTHALQDQHFNLESFVNPNSDNSDALLARSALVEGDASAVMFDEMRRQLGQKPLREEENIQSLLLQNVLGVSLIGAAGGAPLTLKLTLVFPYTSGVRFVHQLLRRGGYAEITRVFGSPPRSTEEILHPQKFFADRPDFAIPSEKELVEAAGGGMAAYHDTIGEFLIGALLGMGLDDKQRAAVAAAGWGGDLVTVIRSGNGQIVAWRSDWDSERDAEEFQLAFRDASERLFPGMKTDGSAEIWQGRTAGEEMRCRRSSRQVLVLVQPGTTGAE